MRQLSSLAAPGWTTRSGRSRPADLRPPPIPGRHAVSVDPAARRLDTMEPSPHAKTVSRRRTRPIGLLAVVLVLAVGSVAAGCGSSSSSPATATVDAVVKPPDITLQGCTYEVDGKVPVGEPQGIQPPFAAFTPDQAAIDALQHIDRHGGTGLVDGFNIPSGTELYAGPDGTAAPVGTIALGRSMQIADPVLWTTNSGQHWLATFLACGGPHLYWIDVSQVATADPSSGAQISSTITELLASAPFTRTGMASSLPITIDARRHLAWVSDKVSFAIGRGVYLGF